MIANIQVTLKERSTQNKVCYIQESKFKMPLRNFLTQLEEKPNKRSRVRKMVSTIKVLEDASVSVLAPMRSKVSLLNALFVRVIRTLRQVAI